MHICILQHVAFEGPARIADWLISQGHTFTICHLYQAEPLPKVKDFDALIVLGGPMNVSDEALYPWLAAEKRLIRKTLESDRPLLGICLGGQLIAEALGAHIQPCQDAEIGWWPIEKHALCDLAWPPVLKVFHWHAQGFSLPVDAQPLAFSPACEHQGFTWDAGRVIGLQFHLETTQASAQALITHCAPDWQAQGAYIQGPEAILADLQGFSGLASVLDLLLLHWLQA